MTDHTDPPGRQGRLSRLDNEVERLRRSPTPTQERRSSADRAADWTNPERVNEKLTDFISYGAPFMGIFSRTRDIIAQF